MIALLSHLDTLILKILGEPPCYVMQSALYLYCLGGYMCIMYYVYEHCTYSTTYLQVTLPHGIRGNAYGLITQTNLYKLQLFYLLNSYALHFEFITIYNMNIFNCYLSVLPCVSFPLY